MATPVNIPNESGKQFRLDSNDRATMLGILFAGASEPEILGAGQLWADTANKMIKQRNTDNSSWVDLWPMDLEYAQSITVEGGAVMNHSLYRVDRRDLQLLADETNIDTDYNSDMNNILTAGQVVLEDPNVIIVVSNLAPNSGNPILVECFNLGNKTGFQRQTEIGSLTFWGREYNTDDNGVVTFSEWSQVKANVSIKDLGAATDSVAITGDVLSFFTTEWRASGFYHSPAGAAHNPDATTPYSFDLNVVARDANGIMTDGTLKAQQIGGSQIAYCQSLLAGVWASDWARVYEGAGGVNTVNGKTGDVVVTMADLGYTVTTSVHDITQGHLLKVGDFNFGLADMPIAVGLDFNTYTFAIGENLFIQTTSAINAPPALTSGYYYCLIFGVGNSSSGDVGCIFQNYLDPTDNIYATRKNNGDGTFTWITSKALMENGHASVSTLEITGGTISTRTSAAPFEFHLADEITGNLYWDIHTQYPETDYEFRWMYSSDGQNITLMSGHGAAYFNIDILNATQQIVEAGQRVYSANNPPPYPVTSVNGMTGAVTISTGAPASGAIGDTFLGVFTGNIFTTVTGDADHYQYVTSGSSTAGSNLSRCDGFELIATSSSGGRVQYAESEFPLVNTNVPSPATYGGTWRIQASQFFGDNPAAQESFAVFMRIA